ncbi:MAG: hypothetical protein WCL39_01040, partial [Armatimonadota bacterium]
MNLSAKTAYSQHVIVMLFAIPVAALNLCQSVCAEPAKPARPRQARIIRDINSVPVFARIATTLDPLQIAREAWKGYLTKQPDSWGMTDKGKPEYRFNFDSRALPWP